MKKFKINELDFVSMTKEEAIKNVIKGCEFVGFNLVEFLSFNNNVVEFIIEAYEEEVSTYYEKFNLNNDLETYYKEA